MAFERGRDRFLGLTHRHFVGMARGHGNSYAGAQCQSALECLNHQRALASRTNSRHDRLLQMKKGLFTTGAHNRLAGTIAPFRSRLWVEPKQVVQNEAVAENFE